MMMLLNKLGKIKSGRFVVIGTRRDFSRKLGPVKNKVTPADRQKIQALDQMLQTDKDQSFFKTFADDAIYEKIKELRR